MSSTMRCTIGAASRNARTGASLPLRGPKLRLPIRVRQAAHVEHEVGVGGQAVLVAERLDHDRHRARRARRDSLANLLAQRVDRHARRVDDELGRVDDRREELALLGDRFLEARLVVRQRMLAARLAEARQQHLRVGLQEDDLARQPVLRAASARASAPRRDRWDGCARPSRCRRSRTPGLCAGRSRR